MFKIKRETRVHDNKAELSRKNMKALGRITDHPDAEFLETVRSPGPVFDFSLKALTTAPTRKAIT